MEDEHLCKGQQIVRSVILTLFGALTITLVPHLSQAITRERSVKQFVSAFHGLLVHRTAWLLLSRPERSGNADKLISWR